ncbi:uncharacterized protein VDAG_07841 [Verticillium dahliae VdLs.17]|uniref:Uncharacterized protein n=1 Tax=Verticillium dahliae (strain VdLs.17 / ATCC MYA-4575 / FGSC 10137) TaxID=498257 RepID=G2XCF9_VERDV|nr:uncharacterized protein VDAG_07841 [Verticillium dahliae VdLs.17]EGY16677.1 hypothetical protein VDAG_07841 [Verticillium dahliae VdLs.17]KAH6706954.1 hypothetical protein EV126DRAFT_356407 [Verticillium dahliae]
MRNAPLVSHLDHNTTAMDRHASKLNAHASFKHEDENEDSLSLLSLDVNEYEMTFMFSPTMSPLQQISDQQNTVQRVPNIDVDGESRVLSNARRQENAPQNKTTLINSETPKKEQILSSAQSMKSQGRRSAYTYPTAAEVEERVRRQREIATWTPPRHLMQRSINENAYRAISCVGSALGTGISRAAVGSAAGASALFHHARRQISPTQHQNPFQPAHTKHVRTLDGEDGWVEVSGT